jgi:hypothetical protein
MSMTFPSITTYYKHERFLNTPLSMSDDLLQTFTNLPYDEINLCLTDILTNLLNTIANAQAMVNMLEFYCRKLNNLDHIEVCFIIKHRLGVVSNNIMENIIKLVSTYTKIEGSIVLIVRSEKSEQPDDILIVKSEQPDDILIVKSEQPDDILIVKSEQAEPAVKKLRRSTRRCS